MCPARRHSVLLKSMLSTVSNCTLAYYYVVNVEALMVYVCIVWFLTMVKCISVLDGNIRLLNWANNI